MHMGLSSYVAYAKLKRASIPLLQWICELLFMLIRYFSQVLIHCNSVTQKLGNSCGPLDS